MISNEAASTNSILYAILPDGSPVQTAMLRIRSHGLLSFFSFFPTVRYSKAGNLRKSCHSVRTLSSSSRCIFQRSSSWSLPELPPHLHSSLIPISLNWQQFSLAGPVITESITVTEHLAVIQMRTLRYRWLNLPILLTYHPASSMSISEKQIVPGQHLHIGHKIHVSISLAMTSPVTFSAYDCRILWHRTGKHRSTTLASETSIPQLQPTTTSEPLRQL